MRKLNVMVIIICNKDQQKYFEQLVTSIVGDQSEMKPVFVRDDEELDTIFLSQKTKIYQIIVEAELNWDENILESFYGFNIAMRLRRAYLVKAPIIICSSLQKSEFQAIANSDNKYNFLDAKGTGFLTFHASTEILNQQILELKALSDADLHNVIIEYCGLQKEWRLTSHKLGNILTDNQNKNKEIQRIVNEWAKSIEKFAPDQKDNLESFQNLIKLSPHLVSPLDLKRALENLDFGLQNSQTISGNSLYYKDQNSELPKCPPKGFSKILVADDTPQTSLINSLRIEYRYNVIDQAEKLSKAKQLLDREKPDIILSDLYFKKSDRKTEIPDKSVGDEFIKYALTHPQYKNGKPQKPIILVTSKASVRSETEIRSGAINCSGAFRATNPAYIHNVIWAAAEERGVHEIEKVSEIDWTLEHTCRQRIEFYETDLPKFIRQWSGFDTLVRDSLNLSKLLLKSSNSADRSTVKKLYDLLKPYETKSNFSFENVKNIFLATNEIHEEAKISPDSETKRRIRNILHGKIEQFSSVTNAIEFMQSVLSDVAADLISLSAYKSAGIDLSKTLTEFSKSKSLLPYLNSLNKKITKLLRTLPKLPIVQSTGNQEEQTSPRRKVNIIVAEDNQFWREFVTNTIEKTEGALGKTHQLNYLTFNNAADALAAIQQKKQSHAITNDDHDNVTSIAIVDICLPKDQQHVKKILSATEGESDEFTTPDSVNGLNLIQHLCSYKYNIPVIVFSTIDSIDDRKKICSWGVPENSFISKDSNSENAIVQALVRFIENSNKFVVERIQDNNGDSRFRINGIEIPFPSELNDTFSAMYNLRQTKATNGFSVSEIIETRGDLLTEESKGAIQDQIYRIRKLIFETLQRNRVYVNAREFIKTIKLDQTDQFTYKLNAEVASIEQEDDKELDIEAFENDVCKVLIIENNSQLLSEITETLESLNYEVDYVRNIQDAVEKAINFRPDIVCLSANLPQTEKISDRIINNESLELRAWSQIRLALADKSIGIIVLMENTRNNFLVAQAAQMEIPISNLISTSEENWLNIFLKKVKDEHRKVYLGEVNDASSDINEPIIEILEGSDLSKGVLRLLIDGEPFNPKKGTEVAKILGLLLNNPKTLLGFELIKSSIGNPKPVTKDDPKNWTQRIRKFIANDWLKFQETNVAKEFREKVLESSSKGLRLNVQIFDSRFKKFGNR